MILNYEKKHVKQLMNKLLKLTKNTMTTKCHLFLAYIFFTVN